ncbi:MAG TPA: hypothetical protein PLN94_14300, partial [Thiolinea sp.]|nr:hypothetical protein [Thiolinea sp.]
MPYPNDTDNADTAAPAETGNGLWPAADYFAALQKLQAAIGKPVFVAEINLSEINAGIKISSSPLILLAIVAFPRPDPLRQLCPHLLVFDDGRGINLGHIARISLECAFAPSPAQTLYLNRPFTREQLFAPRTLSREQLGRTSRALLAEMFGPEPGRLLAGLNTADTTGPATDAP